MCLQAEVNRLLKHKLNNSVIEFVGSRKPLKARQNQEVLFCLDNVVKMYFDITRQVPKLIN